MLNYSLYSGLQLKDIARSKGIKILCNSSKLDTIKLIENFNNTKKNTYAFNSVAQR